MYFLAERTCALTVGGAYLGLVDGFERSAELSPQDGLFCELKPLGDFLPVRFRFDDDFLFAPPPHIDLYFTEKGAAVCAGGFLRADQTLRILAQTRLGNSLLTFTQQGKFLLDLENETGFHLIELPEAFAPYEAELSPAGYLLRGQGGFLLLSRSGEKVLVSEGRVLENGARLRAEVSFRDSAGHTALCEYEGKRLVSCSVRTAREPTAATFALALFESALVGADCSPYLSESLRGKAGALKEYLGDFTSVVLTGEPDRIGLVFPRKEHVFDVRYYRVETADGKVTNLYPSP